jgi:membrane-associated protease RseP (regulator of RpoE activity)
MSRFSAGTATLLIMLAAAGLIQAQSVYTISGNGQGDAFAFSAEGSGAYLGVRLEEETEHPEGGARVTYVADGSPADEAGLQEGDIIVGFNGEIVRGPVAVTKRIHAAEPGDSVELRVVRDGRERTLEAELSQRKGLFYSFDADDEGVEWRGQLADAMELLDEKVGSGSYNVPVPRVDTSLWFNWSKPKLGVELVETTVELREHLGGGDDEGVLVSKVLDGTPAERGGIRVGDLILSVDGESVSSVDELREALADKQGESFPVRVAREGRVVTIDVKIPEPDRDRPTGPRARLAPPAPPVPPAPLAVVAPAPAVPAPAPTPLVSPRPLPPVPAPPLPPRPAPVPPRPAGSRLV